MSQSLSKNLNQSVSIQAEDFSIDAENGRLLKDCLGAGAVVNFVGVVRDRNSVAGPHSRPASEEDKITAMALEHYPGMTEKSITAIQQHAGERWAVKGSRVIHRVGELQAGEQIVYVGVCSAHRHEAFAACEFIMDFLKTRAPFWKKEKTSMGSHWVDARDGDEQALERWS